MLGAVPWCSVGAWPPGTGAAESSFGPGAGPAAWSFGNDPAQSNDTLPASASGSRSSLKGHREMCIKFL